jgi:hypothetical protein
MGVWSPHAVPTREPPPLPRERPRVPSAQRLSRLPTAHGARAEPRGVPRATAGPAFAHATAIAPHAAAHGGPNAAVHGARDADADAPYVGAAALPATAADAAATASPTPHASTARTASARRAPAGRAPTVLCARAWRDHGHGGVHWRVRGWGWSPSTRVEQIQTPLRERGPGGLTGGGH